MCYYFDVVFHYLTGSTQTATTHRHTLSGRLRSFFPLPLLKKKKNLHHLLSLKHTVTHLFDESALELRLSSLHITATLKSTTSPRARRGASGGERTKAGRRSGVDK